MARFEIHALEEEERYYRIILALVALLLGGVAIGIMTIALPSPGESAGRAPARSTPRGCCWAAARASPIRSPCRI